MPLTIHFLNVNRGDCILIEFPSRRVGMIDVCDIGILDQDTRKELLAELTSAQKLALNLAESRALFESRVSLEEAYAKRVAAPTTDPVEYFVDNFPGRAIFRLIVTHPHMDHLSGIYRLARNVEIENFWHAGDDDFDLNGADWSKGPYRQEDWEAYKILRDDSGSPPRSLCKQRGAHGDYWSVDGVQVWAATPALVAAAVAKNDQNILSRVLRIEYAGRAIVLGGDATANETWPDIYENLDLSGVSVLKASHHGRNTGYYMQAVREMSPWLTITSVGEAAHDATNKYRRFSQHTVSLRYSGTFSITIGDDGVLRYPVSLEDHWKPQLTYLPSRAARTLHKGDAGGCLPFCRGLPRATDGRETP